MIRAREMTENEATDRGTTRSIADLASQKATIYAIDPRLLRTDAGFNARLVDFDPEDEVDLALARSIAEVGVKQPLTVFMREGEPTVTDGHRRLGATLHAMDVLGADIKTVPVQTEPKYASAADRAYSVLLRNDSRQLAPIERANQYAKLIGFGHSESDIAIKIGRSRQHVADMLALRAGPQAVVEMVQAGEVSATLATQAIKASKGDETIALERLTEGAKVAEAAGKKRVTAKHLKVKPSESEAPAKLESRETFLDGIRHALEIMRPFLAQDDGRGGTDGASAIRQVVDALKAELER